MFLCLLFAQPVSDTLWLAGLFFFLQTGKHVLYSQLLLSTQSCASLYDQF